MMLTPVRFASVVPALIVARRAAIERRTVDRLKDAGATIAERAILLEEGGAMVGSVHRQLREAGALVAAGNNRYYFNEAAYLGLRRRRRQHGLIVFAVLTAVLAVAVLVGVLL